MSSFVRTVQKRIMRDKFGFTRQTKKVTTDLNGRPSIVNLGKGVGNIIDGNGDDTGSKHYPRLLTPSAKEA